MTTQAKKLEQLHQALRQYQEQGSDLFDHQKEAAKADVRRRALLLLDQRARSRYELKERLLALDFHEEIVEAVLEDFERSGLIDDLHFATEWVRQRHQRRGKGRSALELELKTKGIAAEIRAEALEQISSAAETNMALQLARKKVQAVRSIPVDRPEKEKQLRRIVAMLARRGFGQTTCISSAQQALAERIEELGTYAR